MKNRLAYMTAVIAISTSVMADTSSDLKKCADKRDNKIMFGTPSNIADNIYIKCVDCVKTKQQRQAKYNSVMSNPQTQSYKRFIDSCGTHKILTQYEPPQQGICGDPDGVHWNCIKSARSFYVEQEYCNMMLKPSFVNVFFDNHGLQSHRMINGQDTIVNAPGPYSQSEYQKRLALRPPEDIHLKIESTVPVGKDLLSDSERSKNEECDDIRGW